MATITFGLAQTYDWSSSYWSTVTNVVAAGVNSSSAAAEDGWVILSEVTATLSEAWDDLTGWTEDSKDACDSLIDPAGQLHQYAASGTGSDDTTITDDDWASGSASSTWTLTLAMQMGTQSISTATNLNRGGYFVFDDGTRFYEWNVRSDGTNFDLYTHDADNTWYKHDTTHAVDTNWHRVTYRNNNTVDALELLIDGVVYMTTGHTRGNVASSGRLWLGQFWDAGDAATVEHHVAQVDYYNTYTAFQTTDGVLESDVTDAIYDAGLGSRWSQVDWTHDTSNSTALTYQVRCADSSADLTNMSYETISSSGDSIVSKGRFIQVKITFADASSGQYTPVLKTLTLTNETAVSTAQCVGNPF
jgi:hypothetical protein